MSQENGALEDPFPVVTAHILDKVKYRLYGRMGKGGILEGMTPANTFFERRFTMGALELPAVFVIEENITPVIISGYKDQFQLPLTFSALVEDTDTKRGQRKAKEYSEHFIDIFARGKANRSLDDYIMDTQVVFNTAVYRDTEKQDLYWAATQFNFIFISRMA